MVAEGTRTRRDREVRVRRRRAREGRDVDARRVVGHRERSGDLRARVKVETSRTDQEFSVEPVLV